MTDRFQILVEPRPTSGDPATRRLAIRLGDVWLTQLIRHGSDRSDRCLEAPPLPLAFWFVDNWWRIHCEPPPLQRDFPARWRIAHHLPSVGAGYPWPNVSLWGEGSRCAVMIHEDAHSLQRALRFVAEPALEYVASTTAVSAIDTFIRRVLEDAGSDCDGLDQEYRDLLAERTEALLGFDPARRGLYQHTKHCSPLSRPSTASHRLSGSRSKVHSPTTPSPPPGPLFIPSHRTLAT